MEFTEKEKFWLEDAIEQLELKIGNAGYSEEDDEAFDNLSKKLKSLMAE